MSQLAVPKLVEQVALNAWKEQEGSRVCLHLRPSQRHLNSASAQQKLAEALGVLYGTPVELTIVEDDNPAMRTPLEWRQAIYEEKLAQAREAIIADNNIQTLRRFFDADLDEESIRPFECQSDWHSVPLTMTEREAYVWWKRRPGNLMKQAQQMQEKCRRCRKRSLSWK